MAAARARLNLLRSSRYASNTVAAYASDWARFEGWCERAGKKPLPANPEDVALYLSHSLPTHKVSTLGRWLAAIRSRHQAAGLPAPVTPMVRQVLSGARRTGRNRIRRKAAISVDELSAISRRLLAVGTVRAVRDRAVLLLGFACAFRRSDLGSLDLADVEVSADRLTISLARSKTDQEGRGRQLVIPKAAVREELDPVSSLSDWIVERGRWPGPLFSKIARGDKVFRRAMSGHEVWYALRTAAEAAGLDYRRFGAHSLRAGFVTTASDGGADVFDIMAVTGHKSVEVLGSYVRRGVHRYPLAKVV
jgi:site-specific recombinase XerD